MKNKTTIKISCLLAAMAIGLANAPAAEPAIPKPDGKPADMTKPVQVFILMGQSNMVGMGDISGGSAGWASTLVKPVLSVYEGAYSPEADYDKMTAVSTTELDVKGEWKAPNPPNEFTGVVRGQIQMKDAGQYEFSPGYAGSTRNIMVIDGTEVYRCETENNAVRKSFTFEAGPMLQPSAGCASRR